VTAHAFDEGRPTPAQSGLKLVWRDEFNGRAGEPPAAATWSHELGDGSAQGNPGWGNNELQWYTDAVENAAQDGRGNLGITARRDSDGAAPTYSSARLVTKGKLELEQGRIEARIRVPRGSGLWPAFWALGTSIDSVGWPASGEIDVMEHVGRQPRRVYGAVHGPGYSGSAGIAHTVDLADDVAARFHVFAVDWKPCEIVWSIDGEEYHRVTPEDVAPNAWVFDQPFYLLLNVAVGGDLGGDVGDDTVFPQSMLVDYVRVFEPDRARPA
jgi:beta-glucanase (GH16 family)